MKPLVVLSLFLLSFVLVEDEPKKFEVTMTADEQVLYDLLMAYRKEKNLPSIPLSKSLCYVAQQHAQDLLVNKPDLGDNCNAHSWSAKGAWSSCCYTPDHAQSTCMWNKPKELTNYKEYGFEIACGSSDPQYGDFIMTPEYAISSWKKSPGHNGVIVNNDPWKTFTWNAIGIGMNKGFAIVWFGASPDKDGAPAKAESK